MKQYAQKPASISHVIEAKPRASHQGTMKEMLEAWRSHPIQKREAISLSGSQHGQCGVLQRMPNEDVIASLDRPPFQLTGSTSCWFLAVLYGMYRAKWIRNLFETNVIEVETLRTNCYRCKDASRNFEIQYRNDNRPLWQQVLEAFIEKEMGKIPNEYLNDKAGTSFQERIKPVGTSGVIPRDSVGSALGMLLGMINKEWKVVKAQSSSRPEMIGENSPLKGIPRRNYLVSREEDGLEVLEIITVEKSGHVMSVVPDTLTFEPKEIPSIFGPKGCKKSGVKISGLQVFNQSFLENNIQKYKDADPTNGVALIPEAKEPHKWAKELTHINYYKISRPPQPKNQPSADIRPMLSTVSAFNPVLMASEKPEAKYQDPESLKKTSTFSFFSPSVAIKPAITNPKPESPKPSVKTNTPWVPRRGDPQITTTRSMLARVGSQIVQTPRSSAFVRENPYGSLGLGLNLPVNPITISSQTGVRAMEEVKKMKR